MLIAFHDRTGLPGAVSNVQTWRSNAVPPAQDNTCTAKRRDIHPALEDDRAARFYGKQGWNRVATMVYQAETSDGPFPIENWRNEKALQLTDKNPI